MVEMNYAMLVSHSLTVGHSSSSNTFIEALLKSLPPINISVAPFLCKSVVELLLRMIV